MLSDRLSDGQGTESIPLSEADAKALAVLAKKGDVTADELKSLGISADEVIRFEYLAQQAFKSGLTAATISVVLNVTPEVYRAISYLIQNGELDEKQFQRIGFAALKGSSEGFVRGSISAAITIACKSGMLGEALKGISPSMVRSPDTYLAGDRMTVDLNTVPSSFTEEDAQHMEEEILSTFQIEQIDTSRESVRRILSGQTPRDDEEHRIYGMKQGLEFIADISNSITEENLFRLYQMTIGDFLSEEERLLPGHWYRHDGVTVIDSKTEHIGLPWQKLPVYMKELVEFAAEKAAQNDLIKAAILHFALAYLHPYFDGNGRMARLLHLWYLVQQGYSSVLFVPMSRFVEESCSRYYKAYTQVEQNQQISGVLDVTPFLVYFAESVYYRLGKEQP